MSYVGHHATVRDYDFGLRGAMAEPMSLSPKKNAIAAKGNAYNPANRIRGSLSPIVEGSEVGLDGVFNMLKRSLVLDINQAGAGKVLNNAVTR